MRMVSSHFSVRLSTLQNLGSQLRDVSETVRFGAVFPEATGAEEYEEITSALKDFREDWDNATQRLVQKTGSWGEKATNIGQLMGEHDQALAAAFRGEES
ncbi:hypothetical protein [Herbidospora daliensis]|uniref:hypothetical protein n=1 Tax=Herbidospora daliensis TaxID=295585 RepID=UPI0012FCD796|nr:hypothetical protein [Herbidospora daliensis]